MANCGKCGSELIGSGKFCATCGAPVAAPPAPQPMEPAPNTIAAGTPSGAHADRSAVQPSIPYSTAYDVPSNVNPFAATASPSHPLQPASSSSILAAAVGSDKSAVIAPAASIAATAPAGGGIAPHSEGAPKSQPPPGSSHVSPLAVSNAHSQRNAYKEAVEAALEKDRASLPAPQPTSSDTPASEPQSNEPPKAKKKPGTQLMVNAPNRPAPAKADGAPPAKKAPARTVAMGFNAAVAKMNASSPSGASSTSAPQASAPLPSAPQQPQPPSVVHPPSMPDPQSAWNQPSVVQAPSQVAPYPAYQQPPQPPPPQPPPPQPQFPAGPGGWGWTAPQAGQSQQQYNPYPFAYTPGSRVHVTWSNGQRYPATINQVSGTQCLVVFPDGQQHWVEMQYISPG